jgi:Na+/phosphate symporter
MVLLKIVTNGVKTAFLGLKKVLDAIKNHPIVAILTAIVAVAGLVATAIKKIKEAAAERAK